MRVREREKEGEGELINAATTQKGSTCTETTALVHAFLQGKGLVTRLSLHIIHTIVCQSRAPFYTTNRQSFVKKRACTLITEKAQETRMGSLI